MWTINAHDVIHLGRTPGGDRFTELVDSIIRSQVAVSNLPQASIHTNLRVNIQDGGVDTLVEQGIVDDPIGWMMERTIWQFKATDAGDVSEGSVLEEVNKRYSRECVLNGYAYRFCICDSRPNVKVDEWERVLN